MFFRHRRRAESNNEQSVSLIPALELGDVAFVYVKSDKTVHRIELGTTEDVASIRSAIEPHENDVMVVSGTYIEQNVRRLAQVFERHHLPKPANALGYVFDFSGDVTTHSSPESLKLGLENSITIPLG